MAKLDYTGDAPEARGALRPRVTPRTELELRDASSS